MTRQIAVTLILALGFMTDAAAQKYLDRLRSARSGGATVTVTQSKEIDELVNGTIAATTSSTTAASASASAGRKSASAGKSSTASAPSSSASASSPSASSSASPSSTASAPKADSSANTDIDEESDADLEAETYVDTSRKVMRNARKTDGFRVQVFAGGNTRADKNKAYEAGSTVKSNFPDQPIYVHFYSPRWKCLMGNFTSYSDAAAILKEVKALGYPQACIVKGKITVPY